MLTGPLPAAGWVAAFLVASMAGCGAVDSDKPSTVTVTAPISATAGPTPPTSSTTTTAGVTAGRIGTGQTVLPSIAAPPVQPEFISVARELTAEEMDAMTGVTWRPGCPVPLSDLRHLTLTYRD